MMRASFQGALIVPVWVKCSFVMIPRCAPEPGNPFAIMTVSAMRGAGEAPGAGGAPGLAPLAPLAWLCPEETAQSHIHGLASAARQPSPAPCGAARPGSRAALARLCRSADRSSLPPLPRADLLANRFQRRRHWVNRSLYVLAPLAVLVIAAQIEFAPAHQNYAWFEFGILACSPSSSGAPLTGFSRRVISARSLQAALSVSRSMRDEATDWYSVVHSQDAELPT
jgi:hypothetical protein